MNGFLREGEYLNIAMWSGPRNLSTAMMVSFAQRQDCAVADEPFYAAYLKETGLKHPMYQAIIEHGETDGEVVADFCTGPVPHGKAVFYQKHMTQHMIPQFDRDWMRKVVNVFLIRDPVHVIASYNIKRENPKLTDIGVVEQSEIFEQVWQLTGESPLVIDSADILANPERMLRNLCTALDLEFDHRMLKWPRGPRAYDGIWAKHWYGAVWESTGFGPPGTAQPALPKALQSLANESQYYFNKLKIHALPLLD